MKINCIISWPLNLISLVTSIFPIRERIEIGETLTHGTEKKRKDTILSGHHRRRYLFIRSSLLHTSESQGSEAQRRSQGGRLEAERTLSIDPGSRNNRNHDRSDGERAQRFRRADAQGGGVQGLLKTSGQGERPSADEGHLSCTFRGKDFSARREKRISPHGFKKGDRSGYPPFHFCQTGGLFKGD